MDKPLQQMFHQFEVHVSQFLTPKIQELNDENNVYTQPNATAELEHIHRVHASRLLKKKLEI